MPNIFPEAEAYFTTFYNDRKELYRLDAEEFRPHSSRGYGYAVKKEHREPIYLVMYAFSLCFGCDLDLRKIRVPENFITPNKVAEAILEYRDFLEKKKASLEGFLPDYQNEMEVPYPLSRTIKKTAEIIDVLNHVLTFKELLPYVKTPLLNIWIKRSIFYEYLLGITEEQLQKVFDAIEVGSSFVQIAGKKIELSRFDEFAVYDSLKALNPYDRPNLIDEMEKEKRYMNSSTYYPIIKRTGYDVTANYTIPEIKEPINKNQGKVLEKPVSKVNGRRIFVSHSSKDEQLVSKFVDTVLILGMGVKPDDIFYTSGVGTGIKSGQDFKQRITDEIKGAKAVIQILTPHYKESEICLNEMGAAWAITDIVIPLLGPPYDYDTGFLHASDQQVKLNKKHALMTLFEDHKAELFYEKQRSDVLSSKIDEFISYLESNEKKTEGN